MKWISKAVAELIGLFLDDGSLVATVLLWIAMVWLLGACLPVDRIWQAGLLFAGLGALFLENVGRAVRISRKGL